MRETLSRMTQNIYDDPAFFDGYSRLNRSVHGLDGATEWPALRAMLPDPRGLRVLDLGCGYGWFCRWAAQQGAAGDVFAGDDHGTPILFPLPHGRGSVSFGRGSDSVAIAR